MADIDQAAIIRNLAAHRVAAHEGFVGFSGRRIWTETEQLLAVLEADLNMRLSSSASKPLDTVADYNEHKPEGAPSYKVFRASFGGWEETKRAARLFALPSSNRHLMIKEGVSQTGAKRRPWEEHELIASLASCIEWNHGHRPTTDQYKDFTREAAQHLPNYNQFKRRFPWYAALDRAVALIRRKPDCYPKSSRLWQIVDGLHGRGGVTPEGC